MNRVLIFVVALLTINISANSQETSTEKASLFTYWSEGESFIYSYEKTRTDFKDGIEVTTTTSSKIRVKVEKETSTYYIVKWRYFDYYDSNFSNINPTILTVIKNIYETEYIYKINESGAFIELVNIDQIKLMLESTFKKYIDQYKDDKTVVATLEAFKKTFLTNTAAINLVIKDIVIIHSFYAKSYKLNKLLEFPTSLDIPLSSDSVQATGSILATIVDNILSIRQILNVNRDEIMKLVNSLIDTYGNGDSEFSDFPEAQYTYKTSLDVDYNTGWFDTYTYESIVDIAIQRRVDITVIKKLD